MEELDIASPWLLYPAAVLLVLAGAALGRRLGERARRRDAENADHLPAVQGALLGLLSLMIGFTLNLSLGRWQARQSAVLHETTAIEGALGRASLLPAGEAAAARRLLADYARTRIALGAPGDRPRRRADIAAMSEAIQDHLWDVGRAVSAQDPTSLSASLFVTALDQVGEANQERLAADYIQIPTLVVFTLNGLAIVAFGYLGFVSGAKAADNRVSNAVMALAFVTVITIVDDLDRPDVGLTTVSQRSLINLERSLRAESAPPAS